MDESLIHIFYFVLVLAVLAVILVVIAVTNSKQEKKIRFEPESFGNTNNSDSEFKSVEVVVTVIDQNCCVKMVGRREPKTIKEFSVSFQTEDGKLLKFDVPEDMYDGFEIGQKGILTVIDGALYGFSLMDKQS